ncbi:hypothetical protein LWC34_23395 [Kibdelosporangium philippinense]|uniref:Major facilitator superfamily (MFS) profile domain-containing protein n=1 Tax=Kibdelosporangium philippinense TaxID=211113 RepID=A0ABS8ZD28_9PSEU|nr:hypothetical protein [Kibdelosporangium philippinense]MCE7005749.1 hypothetical protein [Kibdelosporangium philippinense]
MELSSRRWAVSTSLSLLAATFFVAAAFLPLFVGEVAINGWNGVLITGYQQLAGAVLALVAGLVSRGRVVLLAAAAGVNVGIAAITISTVGSYFHRYPAFEGATVVGTGFWCLGVGQLLVVAAVAVVLPPPAMDLSNRHWGLATKFVVGGRGFAHARSAPAALRGHVGGRARRLLRGNGRCVGRRGHPRTWGSSVKADAVDVGRAGDRVPAAGRCGSGVGRRTVRRSPDRRPDGSSRHQRGVQRRHGVALRSHGARLFHGVPGDRPVWFPAFRHRARRLVLAPWHPGVRRGRFATKRKRAPVAVP